MAGASCCRSSLVASLAVVTMILMSMTSELINIVSATSFNVVNHCGSTLGVQVRENAGGPSIGTTGFSLASGETRSLTPPNGWSGNLGTGTPSLLAEFTINNPAGTDFYDVSAVDGFQLGVGMSITGDGAGVSCSAARSICPSGNINGNACVNPNRDDPNTGYAQNVRASCPDAYSWSKDDHATHGTPTGGTFAITFCP